MKKAIILVYLITMILMPGCKNNFLRDNGKDNALKYLEAIQAGDVEAAFKALDIMETITNWCTERKTKEIGIFKEKTYKECVEYEVDDIRKSIKYEIDLGIIPKTAKFQYLESSKFQGETPASGYFTHYFKITYAENDNRLGNVKVAVMPINYHIDKIPSQNIKIGYALRRDIEHWK